MKISIIGGGNMGSAIINIWLDEKIFQRSDILIFEKNAERKKAFAKQKIKTTIDDFKLLKKAQYIMLAVKPQDIPGVLKNIKPYISSKTIIISIAAGVTIKKIATKLGKVKIVRTMPNMPAQIGMGVTGWAANRRLTAKDKKNVQKILEAMGPAIYFGQENKLNAVTAISGSGPAYVFYFIEALFEAALKLGLNDKEAITLALGTFIGSSMMVNTSPETLTELRAKITSKKGTTEAAIKIFNEKKLKKIILDGVKKAYKRAEELNK